MPTVSAGTTASYTLTGTEEITVTLDSAEYAEAYVMRGTLRMFGARLSSSRSIGQFIAGDVFTVTAVGGPVDYATSSVNTAYGLTSAQLAALSASVNSGGLPILIGASNQLGSSTATTEVAMFTLALPVGTLGPDDALIIRPVFRFVGANGTRTLRIKAGATLGAATTIWSAAHASTVLSTQPYVELQGRHSLTSQVGSWSSNTGNGSALGYGSSSTDLTFTTIDFSVATNIYVTMQLASASDLAELISTRVLVQKGVVA